MIHRVHEWRFPQLNGAYKLEGIITVFLTKRASTKYLMRSSLFIKLNTSVIVGKN